MSVFTNRLTRESETVQSMLSIYCRYHHHLSVFDCHECSYLQNYALDRLQNCPYEAGKTSCKKCPIHCYRPGMKDEVRKVMRFSGPRMILRHPILTLFHFFDNRRKEPVKGDLKLHSDSSYAYEHCPGPLHPPNQKSSIPNL